MRVGCAMWAHRAWLGRHFARSASDLANYGSWCTTVEGNTTFYATPSAETVDRWLAEAPETLRFCFKLPRTITHERRLRHADTELTEFLDRMAPLRSRLGPVQIQLPASFGPSDLDVLAAFLTAVPSSFDWAVEVRHPDFFVGGVSEAPLDQLLRTHGVNRVVLDSRALFAASPVTEEERHAWDSKPRLPVRPVATATHPLIRLIGQSDIDTTVAMWRQWVPKLAAWVADGLEPHVFTHTPDNVDGLILARRFHADVADHLQAAGLSLPPLPTPLRDEEQLGLWE